MTDNLTLPQTIALALTGTPNPVCELCGAPVFVSCGGHLYCKAQWQQGECEDAPARPAPLRETAK